ncbi:hypothetical protein JCM5353_007989 [Sporobolomyces roseus]
MQDLQDYQLPQLQDSGNLQSTTRESHEELVKGVRNELAGVRRDLDELKLDVEDLVRTKERQAGFYHLNALQEQLDQCTKFYRVAVVQSKRQLDALLHYSNRDELFASSGAGGGRDSPAPGGDRKGQSGDDALMSATSDVTEGLRRTLQLLQSEVDRSLVSNELLEQQTSTLSSTTNSYSRLSSLLSTSKTLITSLERADVLDRLLLFFAFSFFVGVCSYIFKKRVVDRGIRVASAVTGVFGSGKGGVKQVREIVKSEFKGEVSAVAAATAAVVGAVKRAREGVREKLRERDEREQGEESLSEKVVEKVKEFTSEPVRERRTRSSEPKSTSTPTREQEQEATTFTSTPTVPSSARLIPTPSSVVQSQEVESVTIDESIPSTSFIPVPLPTGPSTPISPDELDFVPEEEDTEEDSTEPQFEEDEEDENLFEEEFVDLPPSDSAPIPSSTAATAPEEPTPISTSSEAEQPAFTPEPTLEPTPIVDESPEPSLTSDEQSIDFDEEDRLEPTHEASAEPEIDIIPPSTPQSTEPESELSTPPSSPTAASLPDPSPTPILTPTDPDPQPERIEEEEEEQFEPIMPRAEHPPTPLRSLEELSDLFNSQAPTAEDATNQILNDPIPSSSSSEEEVDDPSPLPSSLPSSPTASPSSVDPLPILSIPSIIIEEPLIDSQEHTTTPLDSEDLTPESIPRLDVTEEGREVESELPREEVEEAVDESLLDGMMERQFGSVGMGGFGGNGTSEGMRAEEGDEEVVEEEKREEETSLPVREMETTPLSTEEAESFTEPIEQETTPISSPSPSPSPEVRIGDEETIVPSIDSTPTSLSVPEPASSPSPTSVESTSLFSIDPTPSASPPIEPLDDFDVTTEDQPDLTSDPLDIDTELLDESITEPLTTHLDISDEIEPTSVQLPIETLSPSIPISDETITTPIPSASWLSYSSAAAQQTPLSTPESVVSEEESPETPDPVVAAAPTPAPVPVHSEDPSPPPAVPAPATIVTELLKDKEEGAIPADPQEESIPTPIESPEPLATPTPVPTPSSAIAIEEPEPTFLGDQEETNSDQIYPASDIDQFDSNEEDEEENDSVFDDLPVMRGTEDGANEEGLESLSEGTEEVDDSFIVPPPSNTRVEL